MERGEPNFVPIETQSRTYKCGGPVSYNYVVLALTSFLCHFPLFGDALLLLFAQNITY